MTESSTGACRMKCITGFLSSTSTASRPCTAAIGIWRAKETPLQLSKDEFSALRSTYVVFWDIKLTNEHS